MRRRSCCDAPRHAFANLALKYQFATCISAIYRDTFLRTARLWRSSRGGTDQIYRGCARAKCPPKFYPFASRKRLHTLRIYTRRDAASATQKYRGAQIKRSVCAIKNTEARQACRAVRTKRAAGVRQSFKFYSRKP